jgi:CubicO group peptidase (beta-lactamase class C family)
MRLERINHRMQRYVDEGKLAGILSMVSRHGQIVHMSTCGMMDIEAQKPMQFDTLFRIYSMSKPITSVAVMMLYEEGLFHLDDPVCRFISAFEHSQVYLQTTPAGVELADAERAITIRDLLTHTAGLSYGFEQGYVDELYQKRVRKALEQRPETRLGDMVSAIATIPLVHQPGSAWHYSMATDVLGYLVEVVSGMPFETFLQERVFDPLGMVDTGFDVPASKIGRFAATYGPAEDGGLKLVDAPRTSRFARPTCHPSGGGGLLSTAADYGRFAQMLLNKGELEGVRLLGRKTVEWMTMDHLPEGLSLEDGARGFGLGVSVLKHTARSQVLGSAGSYGWGGAANTHFRIDPREDLIYLLMLQFMPSGTYPVVNDFTTAVYQALVD